jgi:CPA2 family monovalent cation:H+ antiporter-2
MGVTPLLGQIARAATAQLEEQAQTAQVESLLVGKSDLLKAEVKSDAIVVCGYGEVGWSLVNVLTNEYVVDVSTLNGDFSPPSIVAFDNNPSLVEKALGLSKNTVILFGDGANPEVIRSSGVTNPRAIFIAYDEFSKVLSATSRLRMKFTNVPIYARAQSRSEAQTLKASGATEVIVEAVRFCVKYTPDTIFRV